jgi:hypothetical protein
VAAPFLIEWLPIFELFNPLLSISSFISSKNLYKVEFFSKIKIKKSLYYLDRSFLNLSYWLLPGNRRLLSAVNPKQSQYIPSAKIGQISGWIGFAKRCLGSLGLSPSWSFLE